MGTLSIHKATLIHIITINLNFGCGYSAENIVIVGNWVLAKKALPKQKMRSGFTHFWCLTIDFFRDVRKHWGLGNRSRLLSTWKWAESSWISIIPASPQNHVAVFMSSSHCMTCSVNWSQTSWKNLESAPEVKRVVRTPLYKSCVFWGKQEKTKDGRQWGRIFNQQN